jgi:hypothetical protein
VKPRLPRATQFVANSAKGRRQWAAIYRQAGCDFVRKIAAYLSKDLVP